MNRDKVLGLAARMEGAPDHQFGMGDWLVVNGEHVDVSPDYVPVDPEKTCGTAGCIAGWAVLAFPQEAMAVARRWGKDLAVARVATSILGLSAVESEHLFLGRWHPGPPGGRDTWFERTGKSWTIDNITKAEAVAHLRHLATTGDLP